MSDLLFCEAVLRMQGWSYRVRAIPLSLFLSLFIVGTLHFFCFLVCIDCRNSIFFAVSPLPHELSFLVSQWAGGVLCPSLECCGVSLAIPATCEIVEETTMGLWAVGVLSVRCLNVV